MADITVQQKEFINERARRCCEYCLSQIKPVGWALPTDHVYPKQESFKLFVRLPLVRYKGRTIST
jgi:hypothetical protein